MIKQIGYKLNPKKLKKAPQYITPYLFLGAFYYTEDYKYFDIIKPYLDIPEKPKTLEEIQQEFDEKIDDLIENTKLKFYGCKIHAESRYERKFDKINDNFEYAKENGKFPEKHILTYSDKLGVNNFTSNFVIKEGGKEVGYYTFGSGYLRYFMNKKPNFVVRFCMDKLLNFRWVDV